MELVRRSSELVVGKQPNMHKTRHIPIVHFSIQVVGLVM